MSKVCSICKVELPNEAFNKRMLSKDGLRGQCRACQRKHDLNYRRVRAGLKPIHLNAMTVSLEQKSLAQGEEQVTPKRDDFTLPNSALTSAADWLKLALRDGPVQSAVLLKAGQSMGHSFGSLQRAKVYLGLLVKKERTLHGPWYWGLPPKDKRQPQPEDSHAPHE